jgi:hypothetical protein
VCGGRKYNKTKFLYDQLDAFMVDKKLYEIIIVHGRAPGADALARTWAILREHRDFGYPAEWNKFGNSAGPKRNLQMLIEEKPDGVMAFTGGSGTANMINLAKEHGLPIFDYREHLR